MISYNAPPLLNYEVNGGFDISDSIIKNTGRDVGAFLLGIGLNIANTMGMECYVSRVSFIRYVTYICRRILLKLRIPKEEHAFTDKKCRFHPKH